ncbi:MAG: 2-oxoacid:acceptor oxidoreductase subunit alpha [Candidatus Andersenbacteria bacterium]
MAKRRTAGPRAQPSDFTWKVGGEAGTGIKNSALILAKAFIRGGYWVHANVEYPSIVRGGNNTLEVRMSLRPVRSLTGRVNLLAALDERTVKMWHHELVRGGAVVLDRTRIDVAAYESALKKRGVDVFDVPVDRLLGEQHLPPIMRNSVLLGAICGLVCYDIELLEHGFAEVYGDKGHEVVAANQRAALAGFEFVEQNYKDAYECQPRAAPVRRILLEGNEGILLGALKAGLSWYTGYPMTPTSSLLHFGAALSARTNLVAYQPEDEIAAAQMALGASYAGARAMTGTSGGGFSLMVESLGLAAMTETPLVVLLGMRPGPATGLPTRTGQGDLRFALHAGQDEPPRIVLAPGDPAEAFELAFYALDIADRYQLLVILLADKYLLENFWTHEPIQHARLKISRGKLLTAAQVAKLGLPGSPTAYERFAITKDGVSPRVLPGTPGLAGIWRVSADEHNPSGFITENRANRIAMVDKRRRKVATAYREILRKLQPVTVFGNPRAKRAIVSFGSNKGVLLDLLDELATAGKKTDVKVVLLRCLMPFPVAEVQRALKNVRDVRVVEGNDTNLLAGLLREQVGVEASAHLTFYDGRPLTLPTVLEFATARAGKTTRR